MKIVYEIERRFLEKTFHNDIKNSQYDPSFFTGNWILFEIVCCNLKMHSVVKLQYFLFINKELFKNDVNLV